MSADARIAFSVDRARKALERCVAELETDHLLQADVELFEARSWLGRARQGVREVLAARALHAWGPQLEQLEALRRKRSDEMFRAKTEAGT